MSGNELPVRTPDDHLIEVFIGDVESLYSLAFQINATGEETVELHNFVAGIIAGDIEVQEGVSIRGLQQMAAIVGHSLKPLGEYFLEFSASTDRYADACRLAGIATGKMPERDRNLRQSLQQIVQEQENNLAMQQIADGLDEDETMPDGVLLRWTTVHPDGMLSDPSVVAVAIAGRKRDEAKKFLSSHKTSLETVKDMIHTQHQTLQGSFDNAYSDWKTAADVYIDSMDGILGPLQDTADEDRYQRTGDVASVADNIASAAGVAVFIPVPIVMGVAAVVGVLAAGVSTAAEAGQAYKASGHDGSDIRTVDGQVAGEVKQTAEAAGGALTFVKALKLLSQGKKLDPSKPGDKSVPDLSGARGPGPAVDVGVDVTPIQTWQEEADATNPEYDGPDLGLTHPDPDAEPTDGGAGSSSRF